MALSVFVVVAIVAGYYVIPRLLRSGSRIRSLRAWFADPTAHPEWQIYAAERCGAAPFVLPTDGYVGFLWGDSFRPGHAHQGIDVFGPARELGVVPVVAAYSGYLTRESNWKSAVIVRVPSDPLQPGRQIWTFYTHMADERGDSFIAPDFPAGTFDRWVEQGTLLGYQGNFSGDPDHPVGMHLHFSIVKDNGRGQYKNELEIANTYDPSPYLGLNLSSSRAGVEPPACAKGV